MRFTAAVLLSLVACAESVVVEADPCAAIADEAECCAAGCTYLMNHDRCITGERICVGDSPRTACADGATCSDVREYGSSCFDACVRGGGCLTAITDYGICTPWDPPDSGL